MTASHGLSRRKVLLAVATAGAAASTGTGVAGLMADSERTEVGLRAGRLDLDSEPSWGNGGTVDGSATGAISGNEGTETVALSVSDTPSHVWFRTKCRQCDPSELKLQVRFGLDTDADGNVDRWLDGFDGTAEGYLSLRTARERFGEGHLLGELGRDEVWNLVVEWTTDGVVETDLEVDFGFGFYATQARHDGNTEAVAPNWECPTEGCGTEGTATKQVAERGSVASVTQSTDGTDVFALRDGGDPASTGGEQ